MKYAGRNEITFEFGEKVRLSTNHFRKTRPSKNLDYKCAGPYKLSTILNQNAYRLDLPKMIRNHNIFQVSKLDLYTPPVVGHLPWQLQTTFVDELRDEEWEVDRILDSKWRYRKLHYLVLWAGYSHVCMSWTLAENLDNAQELIDEFHREHLSKPHL